MAYIISILILLTLSIYIIYFFYGKRINSFKDYVALNRSIGSAPLAITMITILVAGSALQTMIAGVPIYGINNIVTKLLSYSIIPLIFAYCIFPKLLTFQDTYSLGGIFKHMYGNLAGGIASLGSSILCCYVVYGQLSAIVRIAAIFSQNQKIFITIAGMVAIVQALWMSNSKISSTSIIHFALMIGLLFSLATIVLSLKEVKAAGGGIRGLLQVMTNDTRIQHDVLLTYRPSLGYLLNILQLPIMFLSPPFSQRLLINKDAREMKNAFWGFSFFHIGFYFFIAIIGLGAILINLEKYGTTSIQLSQVISTLSQNGWVGLFYSYLVLVSSINMMSYFLHALSVELSQNVFNHLHQDGQPKHDNNWIQIIILIAGLLCITLALISGKEHYNILFPLFSLLTVLLAPFLLGCIGLKGNKTIFITSIIVFYSTILLLTWLAIYGYFPIKEGIPLYRKFARIEPIAIFASGIAILIAHVFTYGHLQQRDEDSVRLRKRKIEDDFFLDMLRQPLFWAKRKMEQYDHNPATIGAFLLFIFAVPTLGGGNSAASYHGTIFFFLRIVGIVFAIISMLYNLFPYFLKRVFPLLWFGILGYCIPFCQSFFILCDPHNSFLLAQIGILLLLMRVVMDWRTYLVLICMGFLAALGCYIKFVPAEAVQIAFDAKWNLAGILILVLIVTISFMTKQERVNSSRMERNKALAGGFSHDLNNLFHHLVWAFDCEYNNEAIVQVLEEKSEQLKKDSELLKNTLTTAKTISDHVQECRREAKFFHNLVQSEYIDPNDIKALSIEELIKESVTYLPDVYQKKIKIAVSKSSKVLVHPIIVKSAILNLVKNGMWHGDSKQVIIGWDHTTETLYVQDDGKGIPPEKEPYVFELYYTTGGSGIGLPFIKMMLEKINGSISFKTSCNPSDHGTTFFVKLPTAKEEEQALEIDIW